MTPATRWWESLWNCNRLCQEIKQFLEIRIVFSQMADTHPGSYSCSFSTVCSLWGGMNKRLVFGRTEEKGCQPSYIINHISKFGLDRWRGTLWGHCCWVNKLIYKGGTSPWEILRAHQDILLICSLQMLEKFSIDWQFSMNNWKQVLINEASLLSFARGNDLRYKENWAISWAQIDNDFWPKLHQCGTK